METIPLRIQAAAASLILALFLVPAWPASCEADAFSVLQERETPLPGSALDIAVTEDGQYTFVLTDKGEVLIYRGTGDLVQTLKVGRGFDTVQFSKAGNRIILGGSGRQQLKVLSLALVYELDYAGSPIKGSLEAPVTVAVFDDFQ